MIFGNLNAIHKLRRNEADGWGKAREQRELKTQGKKRSTPVDHRSVVDERGVVRPAFGYDGDLEEGLARFEAEFGRTGLNNPWEEFEATPSAGGAGLCAVEADCGMQEPSRGTRGAARRELCIPGTKMAARWEIRPPLEEDGGSAGASTSLEEGGGSAGASHSLKEDGGSAGASHSLEADGGSGGAGPGEIDGGVTEQGTQARAISQGESDGSELVEDL